MANDRRRRHSLGKQLRVLTPLIGFWGFLALTMAIARLGEGGPADDLFLDPQTLTDLPWYAGALSDFNLVAWAVSAAIALLGGWVAFRTNRPSAGRFLVVGCVVSTWLLIDDMFLIHADALPDSVGVPGGISALTIIVPILAWVVLFRHEVRRTRWLMLGCSILALEVAAIAGLHWSVAGGATVVEDGATFLGTCAWTLYFGLTTTDIVRSTVRTAMEREPEPIVTPRVAAPELVSTN